MDDRHRPKYHFTAAENICYPFDPQGCVYWKGRYHLFYACQLDDVGLWGHASSADLLHWQDHPIPLGIAPEDPEEQVYAGGSLINKEGVPTMIYHGVNSGTCIATSTDDELVHWKKHPANPVIPLPNEGDPGYGVYHVWDTCGWVDGDMYYSISGNKPHTPPETDGDVAFLFKSRDLVHWEYVHPFYASDRRWTGADEDCSCPDFFPLGDKHVLMFISHNKGTQYYIGRYEGEKFYPERHGRLNWPGGPSFAQESLLDAKGRRIFWAWLCESRTREAQISSGWSGERSQPRVRSLAADGTLRIDPVEELPALRQNHRQRRDLALADGAEQGLEEVAGDCLELVLDIEPPGAGVCGIKGRCSPDGQEQTAIIFDAANETLTIDTTRSSLSPDIFQPWPIPQGAFHPELMEGGKVDDVRVQEAPLALAPGERLALRIFLAGSVLEVFANGRQCISQRIYPTRSDSLGVALFSRGGEAVVRQLDAWDLTATFSR